MGRTKSPGTSRLVNAKKIKNSVIVISYTIEEKISCHLYTVFTVVLVLRFQCYTSSR